MRSRSCAFWPWRIFGARDEQAGLAVDQARDGGIRGSAGLEIGGEVQGDVAVALRLLAGPFCRKGIEGAQHDVEIGARLRLVEAHQDVAGLDVIALAHPQLADDAADRMLNLLDVALDDELTRGDHGAPDLGEGRPAADAADEGGDDEGGQSSLTSDRRASRIFFGRPSAGGRLGEAHRNGRRHHAISCRARLGGCDL